jgi:hypothetical protein
MSGVTGSQSWTNHSLFREGHVFFNVIALPEQVEVSRQLVPRILIRTQTHDGSFDMGPWHYEGGVMNRSDIEKVAQSSHGQRS